MPTHKPIRLAASTTRERYDALSNSLGGLIVSQLLTLFTTPVIYLMLDRLHRLRHFVDRLFAALRGDPSDNIFSAYPGVRTKGSKNKIGLQEAFEDKDKKGFAWNNLMLQRWTDHNGEEHRVLDDYERNRILVDLTAQPDDVKVQIAETIATNSIPKKTPQIGTHFLKLCGKFDLKRVSENANGFVAFLSAEYPEVEQTASVLRNTR